MSLCLCICLERLTDYLTLNDWSMCVELETSILSALSYNKIYSTSSHRDLFSLSSCVCDPLVQKQCPKSLLKYPLYQIVLEHQGTNDIEHKRPKVKNCLGLDILQCSGQYVLLSNALKAYFCILSKLYSLPHEKDETLKSAQRLVQKSQIEDVLALCVLGQISMYIY